MARWGWRINILGISWLAGAGGLIFWAFHGSLGLAD